MTCISQNGIQVIFVTYYTILNLTIEAITAPNIG